MEALTEGKVFYKDFFLKKFISRKHVRNTNVFTPFTTNVHRGRTHEAVIAHGRATETQY
jgi:hypothetical protein